MAAVETTAESIDVCLLQTWHLKLQFKDFFCFSYSCCYAGAQNSFQLTVNAHPAASACQFLPFFSYPCHCFSLFPSCLCFLPSRLFFMSQLPLTLSPFSFFNFFLTPWLFLYSCKALQFSLPNTHTHTHTHLHWTHPVVNNVPSHTEEHMFMLTANPCDQTPVGSPHPVITAGTSTVSCGNRRLLHCPLHGHD